MRRPHPPSDSNPPFPEAKGSSRKFGKFMSRDFRDHLWAFLDFLDARPVLKRMLLIGVPVLVLALGFGIWGYGRWARNNSVRIARQWLAAGRLDRAGIAVRDAMENQPDMPASWQLASELAWRKGNKTASVEFAKKAAVVSRYEGEDVLAWADAALLADDLRQAEDAASYLDPETARESPRALRLAGEIARREKHFTEARDQFQAALQADIASGPSTLAPDQIPLGIVSLQTGVAADRTRGQALLGKWAADPVWGIDALRALLADAVAHRDREASILWAEGLRVHPRCTLGDIPVCLQALRNASAERYQAMLGPIEKLARASAPSSAELVGWLTEIGDGAEAIRWAGTLDPAIERRPPVAQGVAEALRATRQWAGLLAWVDPGDWGRDLEFIRWAYAMAAERSLGDIEKADGFWHSLYSDGALTPVHALFAGETLYSWSYTKEAAALLWEAADHPDLAYQALGTLARLYQVQRDAVGEYRAFSRLNAMRPSDRKIANNLAYFAVLTDLGSETHIERIAADNFNHESGNATYRATYAFVLVWGGQASRAMALLQPVSHEWRTSPAVAIAYGATLASLGRKSEASEIFASLNPSDLSPVENDWIKAALR